MAVWFVMTSSHKGFWLYIYFVLAARYTRLENNVGKTGAKQPPVGGKTRRRDHSVFQLRFNGWTIQEFNFPFNDVGRRWVRSTPGSSRWQTRWYSTVNRYIKGSGGPQLRKVITLVLGSKLPITIPASCTWSAFEKISIDTYHHYIFLSRDTSSGLKLWPLDGAIFFILSCSAFE